VEGSALKLDIIHGSSEMLPALFFKYEHKRRKTLSEKIYCLHTLEFLFLFYCSCTAFSHSIPDAAFQYLKGTLNRREIHFSHGQIAIA